MSYRDIVVHLTLDPRNAVRIQLAIGLARRFGARVSGLYTVPPPNVPYYMESMTGAAIIGLLEPPGRIAAGEIRLEGRRIDNLPYAEMRKIRGRQIGAIFQDPLTSLNPLYRVGDQLVETILTHLPLNQAQARDRAVKLLEDVQRIELRKTLGLDDPTPVRFVRFVGNAVQGKFGLSYRTTEPVGRMILDRLPATLELSLVAIMVALLVGIPMGVFSGLYPHHWLSRAMMTVSLVGISPPWMAMRRFAHLKRAAR